MKFLTCFNNFIIIQTVGKIEDQNAEANKTPEEPTTVEVLATLADPATIEVSTDPITTIQPPTEES